MTTPDPLRPLRDGVIDAELGASLWLLMEGGTPLVVTGTASPQARATLAADLLGLVPHRPWTIIDADAEPPTTQRLASLLRGGVGFALLWAASDLKDWLARAGMGGLPEDGIRRLGVVVVVDRTSRGLRCSAVHYLRPSERDGQGHVQRRPPAVLATWDDAADRYEHFGWGITPELADRVDRAQADFEDRQRERSRFLSVAPAGGTYDVAALRYLATEPLRRPAPEHEPARPSPFRHGLTDPHEH